jgi:hypothetical protein
MNPRRLLDRRHGAQAPRIAAIEEKSTTLSESAQAHSSRAAQVLSSAASAQKCRGPAKIIDYNKKKKKVKIKRYKKN